MDQPGKSGGRSAAGRRVACAAPSSDTEYVNEATRTTDDAVDPIGQWLLKLEVTRKVRRFYDGDHPATEPAWRQLEELTAGLPVRVIIIQVTPKGFRVGGRELRGHAARTERLALELFHLGVVAVTVRPPVGVGSLRRFVELLSGLKDQSDESERARIFAEAESLEGIELVPFDVNWFVFSDGLGVEGSAQQRLWEMLVQRITGGVLESSSGSGGLTPEDMALMADTAGDPSGFVKLLVGHLLELLGETEESGQLLDGMALLASVEEMVRTLQADSRHVAVRLMLQNARPPGSLLARLPEILSSALFVDGVEALVNDDVEIPVAVSMLLEKLAAAEPSGMDPWRRRGEDISDDLVLRCRSLLVRMGMAVPGDAPERVPSYVDKPSLRKLLAETTADPAILEAMDPNVQRRHLEQVLRVAYQLFPETVLATAVGGRLVDSFYEHLELGEFSEAGEIACDLLASSDRVLRERITGIHGLSAMLDAVSTWGKVHWRELARIVVLLGVDLVPALITRLRLEDNLSRRRRLLEMVVTIGPTAVPLIRPMLDDERWFVVRNGILLLRQIGDPELAERALGFLAHRDARVVAEAVKTLALVRDPRWIQGVRELASRDDPVAWRELVSLGRRMRHPEIGRLLAETLDARRGSHLKDPETLELIDLLGMFPIREATDALLRIASLSQWRHTFRLTPVWETVARAASRMPITEAEEVLRRVAQLRDPAAGTARALLARRHVGAP